HPGRPHRRTGLSAPLRPPAPPCAPPAGALGRWGGGTPPAPRACSSPGAAPGGPAPPPPTRYTVTVDAELADGLLCWHRGKPPETPSKKGIASDPPPAHPLRHPERALRGGTGGDPQGLTVHLRRADLPLPPRTGGGHRAPPPRRRLLRPG